MTSMDASTRRERKKIKTNDKERTGHLQWSQGGGGADSTDFPVGTGLQRCRVPGSIRILIDNLGYFRFAFLPPDPPEHGPLGLRSGCTGVNGLKS